LGTFAPPSRVYFLTLSPSACKDKEDCWLQCEQPLHTADLCSSAHERYMQSIISPVKAWFPLPRAQVPDEIFHYVGGPPLSQH